MAVDFGGYGWYLAGAGAVFGVLASVWSKIQAIAYRMVGLFIQRVEVPTQAAHDALTAYLIANFRRSKNYDKMFGAIWEYQRDGRYGLIPYEEFGSRTLIFWNGWFPFLFTNQLEQKTTNKETVNKDATKIYSALMFLRGTIDIERLLAEACQVRNAISWEVEELEKAAKTRFVIHHVPKRNDNDSDDDYSSNGLAWYQQGTCRLLDHTPDQLGKRRTTNGSALENLIFPQRIKNLIHEIELWRKSRDWYREKGIPWKRGWLLYGPPGTGKTALARAFAEDMNMPIYVYNLAEMSNHELMRVWSEMQMNVPCIALLEDFDNVFHGRENIARKHTSFGMFLGASNQNNEDNDRSSKRSSSLMMPLTFDCLLNCLDGVERSDGIFTIISTNDITKIDPALGRPRTLPDGTMEFISTRPGRVDKAVELGYMEAADKKKMALRILGSYEDKYREVCDFVDRYPDLQETPAQFQERCAQIALKCYWNEQLQVSEIMQTEIKEDVASKAAQRELELAYAWEAKRNAKANDASPTDEELTHFLEELFK